MAPPLCFSAPANRRYGGAFGGLLAVASAIFALGFAAGAVVRVSLPLQTDTALADAHAAEPMPAAGPNSPRSDASRFIRPR